MADIVGHARRLASTDPGSEVTVQVAVPERQHRYATADVHYPPGGGARAALVVASDVRYSEIEEELVADVEHVAPCRPGQFFARELPPLREVISRPARRPTPAGDGRTGDAGPPRHRVPARTDHVGLAENVT